MSECIDDETQLGAVDDVCTRPTSAGCKNGGTCAPIYSTSQIGDYCRNQYTRLTPQDRDTYIENYCLRNELEEECKCVNRSNNADYIKLKLGNPYPDGCWYVPCTDRMRYFALSDLDKEISCPQNICQFVYNISQVHDVNIDHIKNDINCDFSHGSVIPDPSGTFPSWIYIATLSIFAAFIFVYFFK